MKTRKTVPIWLAMACGLLTSVLVSPKVSAMEPIYHVATDDKVVALTFDDGPHEVNTEQYISLFQKEGVKATFFENGKNISKHPGLLKKLVDAGHEVGNHTVSHPHLSKLESMDQVVEEIKGNQDQIFKDCGVRPKVFRAPFLDYDERVYSILQELNIPAINASKSTKDWSETATVDVVLKRATQNIQAGDIILMHVWPPNTLEAMPRIIRSLKDQGFRFVTVSELLALRN